MCIERYIWYRKKGIAYHHLPLSSDWLDEEDGITEWCSVIDGHWREQGFCVAAFDIDSDSYVLFPCETEKLKELKSWAEKARYRIELAQNM